MVYAKLRLCIKVSLEKTLCVCRARELIVCIYRQGTERNLKFLLAFIPEVVPWQCLIGAAYLPMGEDFNKLKIFS